MPNAYSFSQNTEYNLFRKALLDLIGKLNSKNMRDNCCYQFE